MIVGLALPLSRRPLSTLQAQAIRDSITGIWASESIFRPDLLGELTAGTLTSLLR